MNVDQAHVKASQQGHTVGSSTDTDYLGSVSTLMQSQNGESVRKGPHSYISHHQDTEEVAKQIQGPNVYCHFANGIGEPKYMPVQSWELLTQTLVEALQNHNEVNTVMDLVLFEDAIHHV